MNNSAIEHTKARLEKDIALGNPNWNISVDTVVFLHSILQTQIPKRALEVGTSTGYSAICIAEILTEWSGKLVTIESHAGRFETAKKNIEESALSNITQVRGHAPEILDEIEGTFDFIFFDATKYEHVSYFNALKDRLNPGGIIVADNMLSHVEDMQEYKKTVESDPQFENYIEDVGTGLMVSIKQKC